MWGHRRRLFLSHLLPPSLRPPYLLLALDPVHAKSFRTFVEGFLLCGHGDKRFWVGYCSYYTVPDLNRLALRVQAVIGALTVACCQRLRSVNT